MTDDALSSASACPECGARLTPGQKHCDLCGYSPEDERAPESAVEPAPAATEAVFCNACGWRNPAGARFCSQCGQALQHVRSFSPGGASRPAISQPPAAGTSLGRTLAIVLGSAVLLVVALFVITAISKRAEPAAAQAASTAAPSAEVAQVFAPLTVQQEEQIATLEGELNAASGEEKVRKQYEMVNLLTGYGRPDLAAQAQEDLARLENTTEAWKRAGDLYFQWMGLLEDQGQNPQPVALRVIPAYVQVLAETPQDHDVRTRLAWAYQYDPGNPMKAIEETKAVLAADSAHVGASYNYAYFLMRINRTDQAIAQMERVRRLAGDDSLLVRSANAFIAALREQASAAPGIAP